MLPIEREQEASALAERFGAPLRVEVPVSDSTFEPLSMTDRIGEVCMVVRRPNGKLLTAIKTFYPSGAYRLLTGGIQHGEGIEAALLRELTEETGLDIAVRRFLALIEYRSDTPFSTWAFLVDELGGTLATADPDEEIAEFREIDVAELPALAAHLAALRDDAAPERLGSWEHWGQFRAVVHRVVYTALTEPEYE